MVSDIELKNYIEKYMEKGHKKEDIEDHLIEHGVSKEQLANLNKDESNLFENNMPQIKENTEEPAAPQENLEEENPQYQENQEEEEQQTYQEQQTISNEIEEPTNEQESYENELTENKIEEPTYEDFQENNNPIPIEEKLENMGNLSQTQEDFEIKKRNRNIKIFGVFLFLLLVVIGLITLLEKNDTENIKINVSNNSNISTDPLTDLNTTSNVEIKPLKKDNSSTENQTKTPDFIINSFNYDFSETILNITPFGELKDKIEGLQITGNQTCKINNVSIQQNNTLIKFKINTSESRKCDFTISKPIKIYLINGDSAYKISKILE